MGDDVRSHVIDLSLLKALQQAFQKNVSELIDIYLHDANRKIANLHKAIQETNIENFTAAARELRQRSLDIGAIQFSYHCLALEKATQEMRLERLEQLLILLEKQFIPVSKALTLLKQQSLSTYAKVPA